MREVHGEGGGGEGGGKGGGRWEREVMFEEQMFDEIQPPSTYPHSWALIQLLSLAVWKSERYCWCQKAEWRPGNETKPSRTQKVDSSNELRTETDKSSPVFTFQCWPVRLGANLQRRSGRRR